MIKRRLAFLLKVKERAKPEILKMIPKLTESQTLNYVK